MRHLMAAMIAGADSKRAEDVISDEHKRDAGPAEEPRIEREQSEQMHRHNADGRGPIDALGLHRLRLRNGGALRSHAANVDLCHFFFWLTASVPRIDADTGGFKKWLRVAFD